MRLEKGDHPESRIHLRACSLMNQRQEEGLGKGGMVESSRADPSQGERVLQKSASSARRKVTTIGIAMGTRSG